MQVVTSFESGPLNEEQAEKVEEKFDYSQVAVALKNDRTVAENVFARCAKHHFKKLMGDGVKLSDPQDSTPSPVWVSGVSVMLYFNGSTLDHLRLEELADSLAVSILRIRGEKEISLIEPLNTKILEVGPQVFTFSLKQKWGLNV